ncbi:MAG: aldo/keto reductase [Dehalococcoidales bacterium]|jgi:predicted aldo/keto reductase-like oxidoreductase
MKYRKFGKLDWQVSALGFGAMRLPILNEDYAKIDEAQAIPMIRYAVDHGVNYIDSAWGYHRGFSEVVVEKALWDGYREKVKVATKLPCPDVQTAADFDRLLNEQLGRLSSKIDFYLLHGLNKMQWAKVRDLGVMKWAERQQADGRIGHLGFSFHDNFDAFKEIIDAYDNWTLAQIQYNFMDEQNQAGTKGLEYAHKKGLAVVVMEPIRGGRLARPPEKVVKLWQSAPVQRTPAEWALRWVWNHPEVSTVLSGMGSMQQVAENVATAEHSQPHNLTADEVALVGRVKDAYFSDAVACTGCRYCMPCPNDVDIPRVFNLYNDAVIYGDAARPRRDYGRMKPEQRADNCTKCEQCVEKCPQQLAIPELLEKADAFLTGK